ncbi:MAG: tetratricopeptide repeat protein, partial [Candidatus Omnitrophota bacterium]
DYYDQIIATSPQSPRLGEACLGKANLLYTLEQYPQATEAYLNLIKSATANPSSSEILEKSYLGLAWTYLKSGDAKKAIATFNDIIKQTQNKIIKVSALTQIGDAYQDIGDLNSALESYDKILQDYPDTPYTDYAQYRQGVALLKLGKTKSAILSFQSLERNFPQSKYQSDVRYYMGVAYFNQGDWLVAKDYMAKFIQDLPPDHELQPDAHYILALSSQNLKEYDEAMKIFKKIERVYAQQETLIQKVKMSMAKNLYEKGSIQEALKEFKIILYKYPQSPVALEALLWLGEYYTQIFDFKNAITYYEQIINDYPSSPETAEIRLALGQIYYKTEEYDKALNYFKQITSNDGQELYTKAKLSIADTFARQLDPATAIETYENIIKNSPEFSKDAYIKIASIYKENKEYEKAFLAYKDALGSKTSSANNNIKDSELQFEIADLSEMLNKSNEAVDEYLKIPYLYPSDTTLVIKAYLRAARIFEDKEDWVNAKIIYEKIMAYSVDEKTFAQERLDQINKILENN